MMIALVQMVLYGMTTSRDVNGSQLHVALIAVMAIQVQVQIHLQLQIHLQIHVPVFQAAQVCLMETTNLAMVAMFMSPAPMK